MMLLHLSSLAFFMLSIYSCVQGPWELEQTSFTRQRFLLCGSSQHHHFSTDLEHPDHSQAGRIVLLWFSFIRESNETCIITSVKLLLFTGKSSLVCYGLFNGKSEIRGSSNRRKAGFLVIYELLIHFLIPFGPFCSLILLDWWKFI